MLILTAPQKGTKSHETWPGQSELELFSETADDTVIKPGKGKLFKAVPRPYFYQLLGFTIPAVYN